MIYCINCGTQLSNESKFCQNCGNSQGELPRVHGDNAHINKTETATDDYDLPNKESVQEEIEKGQNKIRFKYYKNIYNSTPSFYGFSKQDKKEVQIE